MNKKIILGSTSPRRKEILNILGISFEIMASNYEEDMTLQSSMSPNELVLTLSRGKGEDIKSRLISQGLMAVIISADTFIVFEGQCIGKPYTIKKQRKLLESFSGKALQIITGIFIYDLYENKEYGETVSSTVLFKKLNKETIEWYINTKEGLDRAGGFAIQEKGNILIDSIQGDWYNIVGLPLGRVFQILQTCKAI